VLSEATACAPGNAHVVLVDAILMGNKILVRPASVTGTKQVLVHVQV